MNTIESVVKSISKSNGMTLATSCVFIFFSIFLTDAHTVAAQGLSSLLSRLYNSAVQNNRPIVLIIDRNNLREEQKYVKPSNVVESSSEDEEETAPAIYLIQSQVPPSLPPPPFPPTPSPPQKRLPQIRGLAALGGLGFAGLGSLGSLGGHGSFGGSGSPGGLYKVPVYRPRGRYPPKVHRGPFKFLGRSTPSPIVKLLRQRECEASQACADKCKQQSSGKKRMVCKAKCEVTYECVPEADEDDDDPCESDSMECGNKNPSTRGIILVPPEKPPCTRC